MHWKFWQREDKEHALREAELNTSRERTYLYRDLAASKTENRQLDEMVKRSLALLRGDDSE